MTDRLKIIVLGYIVRGPIGGMTWHHLQYVLGLLNMGHDVYFLEDSGDSPYCCYDPVRNVTDTDPSYGLKYIQSIFSKLGLKDRWAYYNTHTRDWIGPLNHKVTEIIDSADMVINVSVSNMLRDRFLKIPVRVLIDTDPVFTQIRNIVDPQRLELTNKHTHHFTFGESIMKESCLIPDDGFVWTPTRQPVVPDVWPVTQGPEDGSYSTVMQWDSYAKREYQGIKYGMKAESFSAFQDLPLKVSAKFEVALGSPSAPRNLLRDKGWAIVDPLDVTRDPWTYQKYIQGSKGEFTVAKQGYVIGHSGWFSERSAAYLASGRPVVTQNTGFEDHIPCGRGIFAVNDMDETVVAINEVNVHYEKHCRYAREIAEEYFHADKVLGKLIDQIYVAQTSPSQRERL